MDPFLFVIQCTWIHLSADSFSNRTYFLIVCGKLIHVVINWYLKYLKTKTALEAEIPRHYPTWHDIGYGLQIRQSMISWLNVHPREEIMKTVDISICSCAKFVCSLCVNAFLRYIWYLNYIIIFRNWHFFISNFPVTAQSLQCGRVFLCSLFVKKKSNVQDIQWLFQIDKSVGETILFHTDVLKAQVKFQVIIQVQLQKCSKGGKNT